MAFKSIGQRLGFVSAGDERRAYGEKIRNAERKKFAAREAQHEAREAALVLENRKLRALLAQKGL